MSEQKQLELIELQPGQMSEELAEVLVDQIDVTDFIQPSADFIESVRRFGVLQPPLLCKSSKSEKRKPRYAVIAGRRRVLAAKQIGLTTIKALVRMGVTEKDLSAFPALTLIAQHHFNPNPVAEYRAVVTLLDDGRNMDEIRSSLGIPIDRIHRLLQLRGLPEDILEGVQTGKIAITTAFSMAKLSATFRQKAVRKFRKDGALTGQDVSDVKRVRRDEEMQSVMEGIEESAGDSDRSDVLSRIETLREADPGATSEETFYDGWRKAINAVLEILRNP